MINVKKMKNLFVLLAFVGTVLGVFTSCKKKSSGSGGSSGPSSSQIKSFILDSVAGKITNPPSGTAHGKGTIELEFKGDLGEIIGRLTSATPTIVLQNAQATISPVASAAQDFVDSTVVYTVTSQDKTTSTAYTVAITINGISFPTQPLTPAQLASTIKSYVAATPDGIYNMIGVITNYVSGGQTLGTINLNLFVESTAPPVDLSNLNVTITFNDALANLTVTPNPQVNPVNLSNDVVYTVTNNVQHTTTTYTVSVTKTVVDCVITNSTHLIGTTNKLTGTKVCYLMNNIDLTSTAFIPIPAFNGTLNGNHETITLNTFTNNFNGGSNNVGLFNVLFGTSSTALAQVNDLNIIVPTQPTVWITNFGALAGVAQNASINRVDVTFTGNAGVNGSALGGIIGWVNGGQELNITNSNVVFQQLSQASTNNNGIGGVVGVNQSVNMNIANVSVSGATISDAGANVGGIIGQNLNTSSINIGSSSVNITGTISGSGTTGAIGGVIGSANTGSITLDSLTVTVADLGGTSPTLLNTGGLVGAKSAGNLTIRNSSVNANLQGVIINTSAGGPGGFGGLVGAVDGNNNSIVNSTSTLNFSGTASQVGGLVGFLTSANSSNLNITNSGSSGNISGQQFVGGVVGQLASTNPTISTFTNVYSTGTITAAATGDHAGGLLGGAVNFSITSSTATGTVSGGATSQLIGGLVGAAGGVVTINTSAAKGAVSGAAFVGGLIGQIAGSGAATIITQTYASGSVTGTGNNIGGLIGQHAPGAIALTITDCYSTSAVTAGTSSLLVGGLVGEMHGGTITDSYSTGFSTAPGNNRGSVIGYTDANTTVKRSFVQSGGTAVPYGGTGVATGSDPINPLISPYNYAPFTDGSVWKNTTATPTLVNAP